MGRAGADEVTGSEEEVTTRPDRFVADMDVIVTATSGAGKKVLDITKVKPGCVITDVARPLDLSPEDVAKRPDVLVIESGEIELPIDEIFEARLEVDWTSILKEGKARS